MTDGRAVYRIQYPLMGRPQLRLPERVLQVLDASEFGLRVELGAPPFDIAPGATLEGKLRLAQGVECSIRGSCVRVGEDDFAIVFAVDARLRLPVIFEEQRFLRAKFPDWA